ncbi:MAG: ATP-binding protein [Myxococcales bacterium]
MLRSFAVAHAYRQLPVATLGNLACTSCAALLLCGEQRLFAWLGVQTLCMLINAAIYVAFQAGHARPERRLALWLRRAGTLATAAGWALGFWFWPVRDGGEQWLLMVLCFGGMSAGAATTMVGDPRWFPVFCAVILSPTLLNPNPDPWWSSVMPAVFAVVLSAVVYRGWLTLRETLLLRFENADLLAETERQRDLARALAQAKSRFLAAASHDLRQPVQALLLFIDALARTPGMDSPSSQSVLSTVESTAETVRDMLESLLDLSRLDSGVVSVNAQSMAVRPVLEQAASALEPEARARGIRIQVKGRPLTAHADPALLARVVHNLASNAVRHGDGRVTLGLRRHGNRCVLWVCDRGEGIPAADRERIFEDLVRLPRSATSHPKGLGLGLPMVRRVCQLAEWPLSLRSKPGVGTCFCVSIPTAHAPVELRDSRTRMSATTLGVVLLVEPDALMRGALSNALGSNGWDVVHADDESSALRTYQDLCAQGTPPRVVVTEFRLSLALRGPAFLSKLSAEAQAPFFGVVMTGDVEFRPGQAAPWRLLYKPFSSDRLHQVLCDGLARTKPNFSSPRGSLAQSLGGAQLDRKQPD